MASACDIFIIVEVKLPESGQQKVSKFEVGLNMGNMKIMKPTLVRRLFVTLATSTQASPEMMNPPRKSERPFFM